MRRALGLADVVLPGQVSEAEGEFSERGSQPVPRIGFGGDVVMPAAEVLHERVPGCNGPGRGLSLQSEQRSEPGIRSAVIGLDWVVAVLLYRSAGSSRSGRTRREW